MGILGKYVLYHTTSEGRINSLSEFSFNGKFLLIQDIRGVSLYNTMHLKIKTNYISGLFGKWKSTFNYPNNDLIFINQQCNL